MKYVGWFKYKTDLIEKLRFRLYLIYMRKLTSQEEAENKTKFSTISVIEKCNLYPHVRIKHSHLLVHTME